MIRIDRLEEFFAVCEDQSGNLLHLPRTDLSETVREGDCLIRTETGWQVEEEPRRKLLRKWNKAVEKSRDWALDD